MVAAPEFRTIGQPVARVEGIGKVTGAALYSADLTPPGTLWARLVLSPHPHARIRAVHTGRALAVPGVQLVLTPADVPLRRTGRNLQDQPLLADGQVRFAGDKVAVVVADDAAAAEEGARLVEVDYEELPAVFDPLAAMTAFAPIVHPDVRTYNGYPHQIPDGIPNVCGYRVHNRGDVAAGFAEADLVLEHTFTTHLTHQGYLEPHACVVALTGVGDGDTASAVPGRVEVWASHKLPYILRAQLAVLIERPESDIVVHPITIGGDFGSKGAPFEIPLAYHLAQRTGRPIKFVTSSHDDLVGFSHRHPSRITLRTGVRRDGAMLARDAHIVFNTGAYGALKPSEDGMLTGADYAAGPYRIPNLHTEAFAVYTNLPPSGYMRAPGHPQVCFAVEAHMDLLARALDLDPVEFRRRNVITQGADGHPSVAPQVLDAAVSVMGTLPLAGGRVREGGHAPGSAANGSDRNTAVHTSLSSPSQRVPLAPGSTSGGRLLRGRGVAMCERGTGFGEGSSDVTVNPDGTVTIVSGLPDNGTGALTVVTQIVAEMLGVSFERVRLVRGTTDALPTDVGSAADRMTNVAGHAALAAATQVRDQLAPLAAMMLGVESVDWEGGAWQGQDGRRVTLEELATEMLGPGDPRAHVQVTLTQPRSLDRDYCVQIAEVTVDAETGEVHLDRFTTVQDVGTIINPLGHQGQIEGGLVQGLGYALTEELVVEEGRIVNAHLGDYKLPTIRDIPELVSINLALTGGPGPFAAKAIGELSGVSPAAAVANAVADAIGAPVFDLPITPERVLAALDGRAQR